PRQQKAHGRADDPAAPRRRRRLAEHVGAHEEDQDRLGAHPPRHEPHRPGQAAEQDGRRGRRVASSAAADGQAQQRQARQHERVALEVDDVAERAIVRPAEALVDEEERYEGEGGNGKESRAHGISGTGGDGGHELQPGDAGRREIEGAVMEEVPRGVEDLSVIEDRPVAGRGEQVDGSRDDQGQKPAAPPGRRGGHGTETAVCLVVMRPCRFSTLARTKSANSGWGESGLDLNSGWNCTATYQGWSVISAISTNLPSGVLPEMVRPAWVRQLS